MINKLKKLIVVLVILLCSTILKINAQAIGGGGTGGGSGGGGGGTTSCPSTIYGTCNSTNYNVNTITICTGSNTSGITATSTWHVDNTGTADVTVRVIYKTYNNGTLVSTANGVQSTVAHNSTNNNIAANGNAVSIGQFSVAGIYSITPILQRYCVTDGYWYDVTTGPDCGGFKLVVNPSNTNNSFTLNGTSNNGIFNQCPSAIQNFTLQNIVTGGITNYKIIVEKSTNGITYATPLTTPAYPTTSVPSSIDLTFLFNPSLPTNYTGYLRVTLMVTSNGSCDAGPYSKTQVFQVKSVSTQTDFYMYHSGSICPSAYPLLPPPPAPASTICKPLVSNPTLIPTTMPTNKILLCPALGWQGANSAGVTAIDVTGTNSWSLLVYEADATTGLRKVIGGINAPNINSYLGTGDMLAGQYLRFNDVSIDFNSLNPPFYNSTSTPVLNEYFSSYYTWASAAGQLTAFSAKVYCVELSVQVGNCNVSNKAYFRIANGVGGAQWKTTNNFDNEIDELNNEAIIYPNPSTGIFNLQYDKLINDSKLIITDILGKTIITENNLKKNNRIIDLNNYTNGIYFYKLFNGNEILQGKLIKN